MESLFIGQTDSIDESARDKGFPKTLNSTT